MVRRGMFSFGDEEIPREFRGERDLWSLEEEFLEDQMVVSHHKASEWEDKLSPEAVRDQRRKPGQTLPSSEGNSPKQTASSHHKSH